MAGQADAWLRPSWLRILGDVDALPVGRAGNSHISNRRLCEMPRALSEQ
jgi:hypothetical protein